MEENEKKDYRLHLINTIDNAIDNGISVYDLDVVNKKAIRHNYINKQAVIDKMEELNKEIKSCDEIDAIFKIKQQQILQELLEGEKNELER